MHINPHLDEVFAYFLLVTYGEKWLPGISKASVRFIDGNITGTDEEYDRDGVLPVGCGMGRFDEHRHGIERMANECATTLVAKYLEIDNNAELKNFIDEVLYFDTHSGCRPSQLAELLKAAQRTTKDSYEIMDWAVTGLTSMVKQERYRYSKVPGEKSLLEILRDSTGKDKDLYSEDPRVRQHMFNIVHESMRKKCDNVNLDAGSRTELAWIVEALYRCGHTEESVSDWITIPLDQMLLDQLGFWKEADRLKSEKFIEIRALIETREDTLNMLCVVSDSPQAQKAARYCGAQLIVIRNSLGNVQIYVDTSIRGLNLSNVTRMIRWLELPFAKKRMSWSALGIPGQLQEVEQWYYFKKGEMLFNGSRTSVAKPTLLSNATLVDVMQHAFHPGGLAIWSRKRAIDTRS